MSLYLILHKVRGEPAFDIAERCEAMGTEGDPGPWWIIPTSGHRAWPLRTWDMVELGFGPNPLEWATDDQWDTFPDHYQLTVAPRKTKSTDAEEWKMLEELGFERKGGNITRRFG
jgi:hypothetical protein